MTVKHPGSIVHRFTGRDKREKVIDCILRQRLVQNQRDIADALFLAGEIQNHTEGQEITTQGGIDNDIYFLLSGEVRVEVNGRIVATRMKDIHFGEMALLDATARRSATVRAISDVVVFKVPEGPFLKVANKHSEIWKCISSELAERLRERAKLLPSPNVDAVVFIGSSSEAADVATYLDKALKKQGIATRSWIDGVFQVSETTIESLTNIASQVDFAILLLTPDDITTSRKKKVNSPRDNVIFELGLFMGALGRDRTLIVADKTLGKLPSDLLGVVTLRYEKPKSGPIGRALKLTLQDIRNRVVARGPK
jgi:predicted nucleotide-binding protein